MSLLDMKVLHRVLQKTVIWPCPAIIHIYKTHFLRIVECYVVTTLSFPKRDFIPKCCVYVPWVPCVMHVHLSPSFNYTDTVR